MSTATQERTGTDLEVIEHLDFDPLVRQRALSRAYDHLSEARREQRGGADAHSLSL